MTKLRDQLHYTTYTHSQTRLSLRGSTASNLITTDPPSVCVRQDHLMA